MKKIAIFASGQGSNFISIHNNILSGEINGKIVLLISNNSNSGAIKYAKKHKIKSFIVNKSIYPNILKRDNILINLLKKEKVDLICLAGYMKLLSKCIIQEYKDHILNVHPSLLPKFGGKGFYGMNVHRAVIDSGDKVSGVTIHLVDEQYDTGCIVAQKKIIIRKNDTVEKLATRVLKLEHELYSEVIKSYCKKDGRYHWK